MGSLQRNPIRSNFNRYAPPVPEPSGPKPTRPAPPPVSRPEPELEPLKPPAHAFAVVLVIDGTGYALSLVPRESGDLSLRLWTLTKLGGGEPYQVAELPHAEGRWSCTCGDFVFRHEGNGSTCKHCRAIQHGVDHGILAPLPHVLATDPETDVTWEDLDEHWGIAPTPESRDVTPMFARGAASV